jgi:hypothetical protein
MEWRTGHQLPTLPVPPDRQDEYFLTTGVRGISLDPPPLERPYEGRVLIWGDLHPHNSYSKCVSAMDGLPDEMLRYQRDVLGCRVLTLTDHCDKLGGPEATWLADSLESFAGEHNIPLFSTETGQRPGRHTNWYAPDREAFDRLRCILISQDGDRLRTYRHAIEEMPQGSVVALRHFHGRIASDDELIHSFEGQLEVAMEAMQGRINALLESDERFPRYPNLFLDAGFKVGLVGGTDHFRGRGPNRFCLTGFWVKEVSIDGVWEALRNRYTIAMSNARIAIAARMGGQPAGSTVTVDAESDVRIQLSTSCGRQIVRATLIRDGEILPWVPVGAESATLELVDPSPPPGRHWYVPTVQVKTAYGKATPGYGHVSPFFVHIRDE